MHLVLTGATGLIGSGVLHHMINATSVNQVSIISRRPVPQAEGIQKVKVIIHKDFSNYPSEIMSQLENIDGVVWALGISQTKVNKEDYFAITNTYPMAFAKAISTTTSPNPVNFVYVSGEGATTTPSFMTSRFGVVKGQTEAELLELSKKPEYSNLRPYSMRPAGVDASNHTEIHDFVPNHGMLMGAFQTVGFPAMRVLTPGFMSPTKDLGRFLTELAEGDGAPKDGAGVDGEGRTIGNKAFRRMLGL